MGRFKLRVVAPCTEAWDGMAGHDRARFCTKCARTVHDLSAMTERDARALLTGHTDPLCVRFAVRQDGTVVTGDRWFGRFLGALGVAVAAVVFWTGVTLLQRPWRALARVLAASTSPVPQPFQPSIEDEERRRAYDEVMKRLAESNRAMMAAYGHQMMLGGISRAEGTLDLVRSFPPPKQAKKSRR